MAFLSAGFFLRVRRRFSRFFRSRIAGLRSRLTIRLLVLTVAFVLVAEAILFLPSLAVSRRDYLERVLGEAHLALMAVEASRDGLLDIALQRRLLKNTGTYGMTAERTSGEKLTIGPPISFRVDARFDLDDAQFIDLVADAVASLVRTRARAVAVVGTSPKDPSFRIEAVIPEGPLSRSLRRHVEANLVQSFVISVAGAFILFVVLQWMLVHPLRRLSAAMIAFRNAPEDARRQIVPSRRHDEVGEAEQALADMQRELRLALRQRARLAAVGIGVSKISHDLKGILTAAILESDRLEAAADPELKKTTQGIARALERAVRLVGSILDFAKERPPTPSFAPLLLYRLIEEWRDGLCADLTWEIDCPETLVVSGDHDLLLRALDNLGRNAVEAGASRLCVRAEGDEEWVRVRVADNGPGLPRKALDNLFAPFAGSAKAGGIGLGLPIAREVLQDQGGRLDLEKSSSEGACFVISLVPGLSPKS